MNNIQSDSTRDRVHRRRAPPHHTREDGTRRTGVPGLAGGVRVRGRAAAEEIIYEKGIGSKSFLQCNRLHEFGDITSEEHAVKQTLRESCDLIIFSYKIRGSW